MTHKSERRHRVCGTPVRTGCITCKIRRVKCDEQKPSCKRCTSTGRKCDGYLPVPPVKPNKPTTSVVLAPARGTPIALVAPMTTVPRSMPSLVITNNPREDRLLHFFFTTTATTLSGHFAKDFWLQRVSQILPSVPCVRHAVIALAAVHQELRFKYLSDLSIDGLRSFALRQHAAAINKLQAFMASSSEQFDVPLITCILFVCFESLMGNHSAALMHLKAGLSIIKELQSRQATNLNASGDWAGDFAPLLLGLGVQAGTFINPKKRKDRIALWKIMQCAGNLSIGPFQSFDEARHALNTVAAKILLERTSTRDRVSLQGVIDAPNPRRAQAMEHAELCESWLTRFHQYVQGLNARGLMGNKERCTASLLRTHWLMISIAVDQPKDCIDNFNEMVYLCEQFMNDDTKMPGFALNTIFGTNLGIIAPLLYIVLRAPTQSLKLRGYTMLSKSQGREGMWDAQEGLRVAGAVLDVKHATAPPVFDTSLGNDEGWRIMWSPKVLTPSKPTGVEVDAMEVDALEALDAVDIIEDIPRISGTPFARSEAF
ncbi:hypothetical protein BP5796_04463 [Coleophoma crateriformis]|uniref:Zn(2)-C6 fungal-type domain-containing protein n=1 Tax=Coleophoma crateriformis TaxID=565419 RepID=A0A3D8S9E5_9HELO|nr:hypothetical protein BP5796_04463 [Coleophoma crateriformis]